MKKKPQDIEITEGDRLNKEKRKYERLICHYTVQYNRLELALEIYKKKLGETEDEIRRIDSRGETENH